MKKLNVTKHAIKQYKRRINEVPDVAAKKIICSLIRESYYVSDNKNGVLLKHKTGIIFIVKRRKVITVWRGEMKAAYIIGKILYDLVE